MPLKFVILDCPRRCWDDPRARQLFERIVTLKLAGYATLYDECVIPFDKSDLYGTHVTVCEEQPDGYQPLVAMKLVSLSTCARFNEEFTWLAVLRKASELTFARARKKCVELSRNGQDALYSGSWTSDPNIRSNRELAVRLKEMMFGYMMLECSRRGDPHWMCFGTPTSRTDRFFVSMGMTAMSEEFIQQPGQPAIAFISEHYSEEAKEIAHKWKPDFEARVVIEAANPITERKAA
jgi:hypothetical protein